MSLPPVTVRIKRKATDEPVNFLRVQENGKRQRKADFVFERQIEPLNETTDPARPIKQPRKSLGVQTIKSEVVPDETRVIEVGANGSNGAAKPSQGEGNEQTTMQSIAMQRPRRFHISRMGSTPTGTVIGAGIQKSKRRQTVFVERRTRPKPSSTPEVSSQTQSTTPEEPSELFSPDVTSDRPVTSDPPNSRPQKKPGMAARTSSANSTPMRPSLAPEPSNVRLPSGLLAPWSLSDRQSREEMQAYTLQEIGHSIAEADSFDFINSPSTTTLSPKKPSRFKPKIPNLRYHERHPEEFVKDGSEMDVEVLYEDMDDDSEYIIDTFVRIPADYMDVDSVTEQNIGFLVLEGQNDIDEFYNNASDSDEDEDYDEEDENAENHYTADYPDDEVDSDDEYGRNPYQYANDDAMYSDESDGRTKVSWNKKPAWLRKAEGESDDDGDDSD